MRLVALVCLLFLSVCIRAADILILIKEDDAGPRVPTADYVHPLWILWPAKSDPAGINRLMSLPTGMDWKADGMDAAFEILAKNPKSKNVASLKSRGYFESVHRYLGLTKVTAVEGKAGGFTLDTLQAALTLPGEIPSVKFLDPLPSGLLVASVSGPHAWDEMASLARRVGGRALVVELPQRDGLAWTRAWLKGKGWPKGLPSLRSTDLPGLVPAREALKLLRNPEFTPWRNSDVERWGGVNRWLEFGHFTGPVFLVFVAVFVIYVAGCAVYCVIREEHGKWVLALIRPIVLGPAILILAGRLTAIGQVSRWPTWTAVAAILLVAVAWGINWLVRRVGSQAHPLWGEMVLGLTITALVDPAWSVFGGSIGPHFVPTSPEAFGALAAYGVGAVALGGRTWNATVLMFAGVAALTFAAQTVWIDTKWAGGIILLIATANQWLPFLLFSAGFVGLSEFYAGRLGHLTYAPNDLYATLPASNGLNWAGQVAFIASPTVIGFLLFVSIVWIAGDRFFSHQIRRALSFNRQPLAFVRAAGGLTLCGIFNPIFLHAALVCGLAAVVTILFDAVRAP